jgi:hypothetical protein
LGSGSAGGKYRLGDIHGTLEGTADKYARPARLHGIGRLGFAKSVCVDLDAERVCQLIIIRRWIQANGQHHHIEGLLLDTLIGCCVFDKDISAFRILTHDRCVASDKSSPGKIFSSLKESLKTLAVGTDIVVEDGARRIGVMIFGQDHLFLGIGAAGGRTIAVIALGDPPGPHTLNPGDVMGMLLVGSAQYLAFVGPGGAQQPLVVHTGHHIRNRSVAILALYLGIINIIARTQNDGGNIDAYLLRGLVKVDGVVLTHALTNTAFFLFKVKTAFINIGDQWNGLRKIYMHGLVAGYILVESIRVFDRTVLHTRRAPRAFVFDNVAGLFG